MFNKMDCPNGGPIHDFILYYKLVNQGAGHFEELVQNEDAICSLDPNVNNGQTQLQVSPFFFCVALICFFQLYE